MELARNHGQHWQSVVSISLPRSFIMLITLITVSAGRQATKSLPRSTEPGAQYMNQSVDAAVVNQAAGATHAGLNLHGLKVMVVDDSNTIRRGAELFLTKAGCQVFLAEDGFDALAKIVDHHPDVIFLDIVMPRLDGYQTCALIKKNPRFSNTPVVMLSSRDGVFDRARGRIVGSDQYLTKPFTRDTLLMAANRHASAAASV